MPITKNIHDISNRQKKRRIQTLGTRAQKALWFSKQFGLDLAALQFEDNKGQTYHWKVPETKPISQETPSDPGLPSSSEKKVAWKSHSLSTNQRPFIWPFPLNKC
jgi:predicted acetyltransferase